MKPPAGAPWAPYPWADDLPSLYAVQALYKGTASPEQQQKALDFIIEKLADRNGMSYRPDNTHDTAFAEGRRWVGNQLVKFLKLSPALIEASKRKPAAKR